jgi:hypothetical protein
MQFRDPEEELALLQDALRNGARKEEKTVEKSAGILNVILGQA